MIAQGTDGLSHGDHSTGVMGGKSMQSFIPLHLNAFERSPPLQEWMLDVLLDLNPTVLSPSDWFDGPRREGNFVWFPPPAAAEVVVERLGVAKHKRPNSLHVVVVPRLMTGWWRKQKSKGTDFYIKLDHTILWPFSTQFEPVLVFVSLPLLPHRPNFEARDSIMARLNGALSSLSELHTPTYRGHLRQLFAEAGERSSL